MLTPISIRRALPSERDALVALQTRASLANAGDRDAILAHPDAIDIPLRQLADGQVHVAERVKTIVGFAATLPREDGDTELDALFVEPGMWRQGIGRQLVKYCQEVARSSGSGALHVIGNPHAREFYLASGFDAVGIAETRFGEGIRYRISSRSTRTQGPIMTSPMYANSVPVFKQLLTALRTILTQASAHAAARSMEPDALLQARLYPDMFPLLKQVQVAADFARGISARLAGVEVPVHEGKEQTFADLDGLLAQTLAFLDSVSASQFAGSETKDIVLRPGTPKEKKLTGQTYLSNYGLPQFFFHVTTAYAILRHNGLAIGKRDFMGAY